MRYFGPFFRSTNFYFYLVFLRFPTISCFCFPITFLLILQKWKQPLVLTSKSTRLSGNCITVKPNVSCKKKLNKTLVNFSITYKTFFFLNNINYLITFIRRSLCFRNIGVKPILTHKPSV